MAKAWSDIDNSSYQGQKRSAPTLALLQALRVAHDSTTHTVLWPTPEEELDEQRREKKRRGDNRDGGKGHHRGGGGSGGGNQGGGGYATTSTAVGVAEAEETYLAQVVITTPPFGEQPGRWWPQLWGRTWWPQGRRPRPFLWIRHLQLLQLVS